MGTFDVSYCVEADLRTILPTIASYGKKRTIIGWTVDSGSLYKAGSTGSIEMLYKDGFELGTAQTNKAACEADGEWFYDSALDVVFYYSTDDPTGLNIKAGTDWATLVTSVISKSSEITRAIVGKPIIKHRWGTRDYDEVIISSASAIAVGRLVRPHNKDLADSLERRYNYDGDEFEKGMLQKVRDSEISLSSEITPVLGEGILVESSVDDATTGGINDIKGRANESDTLEIKITFGGTLTLGSENTTIKYQVKGGGLMNTVYVSATLITGYYQTLAHGLQLRFETGVVYTTNDAWYVEVSNEPIETHQAIWSGTTTVRG